MCVVIQKKRKRTKKRENEYLLKKKGVRKRKQKGSLDAYLK